MSRVKIRILPERLELNRRNADGVLAWLLLPIFSILTLVLLYLMVLAASEAMESAPDHVAALSHSRMVSIRV